MKRLTLVCFVTMLFLGWLLAATPAWAQSDLNGAWEIVEASGHNDEGDWKWEAVQPSLYIFLDGYYSIALVRGTEPRPLMPEGTHWETMSAEQLRSVCSGRVFSANSGVYEASGSSLIIKPMVAKWPNFMEGGSETYTYSVEGDTLTLSYEGDTWAFGFTLRRLR